VSLVDPAVSSVTFQSEPIAQCWVEAIPLMVENHAETGVPSKHHKFAPNRAQFERLDELGFLRVFTARKAGKLVGYSVFLVMPPLNYPDDLFAICHVAYVAPEIRGTYSSGKYFIWVEAQLEHEGVTDIGRQSTERFDVSETYKHFGYTKSETVWHRSVR
jgi:hypothetical protein